MRLGSHDNKSAVTGKRLALMADALPVCVAYVDAEERYQFANAVYEDWHGMSPAEIRGKHVRDVVGDKPYAKIRHRIESVLAGNRQSFEYCAEYKSGVTRDVHVDYVPEATHTGQVAGFLALVYDISEQKRAERQLHEALKRCEALTSAAFGGVAATENGVFIDVSDRFAASLGYPREDLVGKPIGDVVTLGTFEIVEEQIRRGDGAVYDAVALRKDGSAFPVEICGVNAPYDGRSVHVVAARDISDRISLEREVLEIGNTERIRIGCDLHDGLGQTLTGVLLVLQAVEKSLTQEGFGEAGRLNDAVDTLEDVIDEVRHISRRLAPILDDIRRLPNALSDLAGEISRAGKVKCRFTCHCQSGVSNRDIAIHLYRIAQEAVNNAIRHSGASVVDVVCATDDDAFYLTVSDNGSGLPSPAKRGRGMGLKTMYYRSRMIGGTLEFAEGRSGGTRVVCCCPLSG